MQTRTWPPSLTMVALVLALSASLLGQETTDAVETGEASYYADAFQGRPTASGEPFDQAALTAAHNGFPLGTRVRVTNVSNGNSVVVMINDRMGPSSTSIIDVTRRAAEELDFIEQGRTTVELIVVHD